MREKILDLIIKIDKMKSTTEIKQKLAEIVIHYDNEKNEKIDINIDVNDKNCCMPSACVSNCCDKPIIDINTAVTLPEDTKKCCVIM